MTHFRILVLIFVCLFCAFVSYADDQIDTKYAHFAVKKQKHVLLIEPRSMRSAVYMLIPGARNTVYSAGYEGPLGVSHYKAEEFRTIFKSDWKQFREKALKDSAKHLTRINPVMVRNSENMIEYGLIQSENPLTASTILLPQFREKFKNYFGSELLVLVPNRSTILVFSGSDNNLNLYKKIVTKMYKDSIYPVSREIFRLNGSGIRVIGDYVGK